MPNDLIEIEIPNRPLSDLVTWLPVGKDMILHL